MAGWHETRPRVDAFWPCQTAVPEGMLIVGVEHRGRILEFSDRP
jgi:hypothetical protein